MEPDQIAERAQQVALRVADAQARGRALSELSRITSKRAVNTWRAEGLSMGDAGLALMCAAFGERFPGSGWDVRGKELLATGMGSGKTSLSLFTGAVGYAAAARLCGGRIPSEDRLLARMASVVRAPHEYDVVTGISGWVPYLHSAAPPAADKVAREVAMALAALLSRTDEPVYCGIAHGLAGPLAALALLRRHGAALHRGARRLMDVAKRVNGVILWPAGGHRVNAGSWCHGSSGVARALYLAGVALDEPEYREFALEAFRTHCARPPRLASPSLCHGLAGQLMISLAFAADEPDVPEVALAVRRLTGELYDRYRPDSLLGYRESEDGAEVDNPGLLRGAAGVALTLLAAATGVPPTWARLLLIT